MSQKLIKRKNAVLILPFLQELPGTQMEDEAKYLFLKVFLVIHKKRINSIEYQHFASHSELSDVSIMQQQVWCQDRDRARHSMPPEHTAAKSLARKTELKSDQVSGLNCRFAGNTVNGGTCWAAPRECNSKIQTVGNHRLNGLGFPQLNCDENKVIEEELVN